MAIFLRWIYQNFALTFFLGVEGLAVFAGIGYVIYSSFDHDSPQKEMNKPAIVFITEPEYKDLLASELIKFNTRETMNYRIEVTDKTEALRRFSKAGNRVLFLPDNISGAEMDTIRTSHPSAQQVSFAFFNENDQAVNLLFIFDEKKNEQEKHLAAFFREENSRHIVFNPNQSGKKKPGRSG